MKPDPELSFRARRILYAVVTEYIATGEPVGSRTLSRRYGLDLSAASIRNVLSDLDEAGYLIQPHTSAGRVPTDKGFRLFVDALVQMREVTTDEREAIASRLSVMAARRDEQLREAGRLLSAMSGTAAIVAPPRAEEHLLAQLRFIPIRGTTVLAVLVSKDGVVQNRVVELDREFPAAEVEHIHNYLAGIVEGRSLADVRAALAERVDSERGEYDVLRKQALSLVRATLAGTHATSDVVIEGQGLLFDRPEFSDPEKIRAFVRTFEEKERLLGLLDRTLRAGGVQVLIGNEVRLGDVDDVSLISARYRAEGGATGSVGLIGPARVDYAKLVPLVDFTARILSDTGGAPEDDGSDDED